MLGCAVSPTPCTVALFCLEPLISLTDCNKNKKHEILSSAADQFYNKSLLGFFALAYNNNLQLIKEQPSQTYTTLNRTH